MSQSPPQCQYDPKIISLNILKDKQDSPEDYEVQLKAFRDFLPNLSVNSMDPKFWNILENYKLSDSRLNQFAKGEIDL